MENMESKHRTKQYCFVCGHDFLETGKTTIELGDMCDCCLFEFGVEDTLYGQGAFMTYRNEWIEEGMPFGGHLAPKDVKWDLDIVLKQLNNLQKLTIETYFNTQTIDENRNWTAEVDIEQIKKNWNKFR